MRARKQVLSITDIHSENNVTYRLRELQDGSANIERWIKHGNHEWNDSGFHLPKKAYKQLQSVLMNYAPQTTKAL